MDPLRMHAYKIQAIKKHKRQQFLSNVLLYSLTTLTCTLFCSSPLWYPPFCATFNVFFFFALPKLCSLFFTSKVLFIVGNLIVIFLVGESKFFASKTKASPAAASYDHDVCSKKYECKAPELHKISPPKEMKGSGIRRSSSKQEMNVKSISTSETYGEQGKTDSSCEEKNCESYAKKKTLEKSSQRGKVVRVVEEGKEEEVEGNEELSLPAEELNKLADDFIARVNRQRRLEAEFCRG